MTPPVALVTGANRGLGYAIVRQLRMRIASVILTSRSEKAGLAAAAVLSTEVGPVCYCRLDVLEPVSIRRAVEFVADHYGRLDLLINNAGAHSSGDGAGLEVDALTLVEAFTNNCVGAVEVTRAFVPLLAVARGRVINISTALGLPSRMSQLPGEYFAYRVAKAALNAATAALAEELRGTIGVAVNAVHPGWLKTSMGGPHAPEEVEAGAQRVIAATFDVAPGTTGKLFIDGLEHPW